MFNKIIRYSKDPYYALGYDMIKKCPRLMSDKFYLSVLWKMVMGYELDWKHPKTFNEKLQWLKLYDRNPIYTSLVDKYRVKKWVTEKIGEQYVTPTLAVYKSVGDINFYKLPNQFVLKCNHDSGSVILCRDKATFDFEKARHELETNFKKNYYWDAREWPYKNVKRLVFAEEYIQDQNKSLTDYKFFCFNGQVDIVMVCVDRHIGQPKFYFFDKKWNLMKLNVRGKEASTNFTLPKPHFLDKMFMLSSILSDGIPFVRIDFYDLGDEIRFGEMTFFPEGGFDSNILPEADSYLGRYIVFDKVFGS